MTSAKTRIAAAAITLILSAAATGCSVPNGTELVEENPLVYVADNLANLFHKNSSCKYLSTEEVPGTDAVIELTQKDAARDGRIPCSHCQILPSDEAGL